MPISKSDFHHLKPPNWGKRISTCQFTQPGRHGHSRTVSRFTVISNVPDVDDVGTVRSYDPYNASRVLQPCGSQVSHAKIIIHRNSPEPGLGRSPTTVSHSYRSYRSVNGSFRQRARANSRRTSTAGQLRSPQASMSSIRSHQSNPRVRANNRSKRSVDFSSIRGKGNRHRRNRLASLAAPASIAGDNTTYDRDTLSPSSPAKGRDARQVSATKSMIDVDATDDNFIWSEELEQLGHRIARDCDEAFRSSLLMSESAELGANPRDSGPFTLSLGDLPAAQLPDGTRPWDNRPLPPVPSQTTTVSPLSVRDRDAGFSLESVSQTVKPYTFHSSLSVKAPERRSVSEPTYTKEARQLPSIYENTPDDRMRREMARRVAVSNPLETPTRAANRGLDFLAKAENTIRVVNSPTARGMEPPVEIPKPLNVRKVSQMTDPPKPAVTPLRPDSRKMDSLPKGQTADGAAAGESAPAKKRVSSWFRRASKEDSSSSSFVTVTDSSVKSREAAREPEANRLSRTLAAQSADDLPGQNGQKKKSFGFSFWKGAREGGRDEPKMSLAGKLQPLSILHTVHLLTACFLLDSDPDDARARNDRSTKKRTSKGSRTNSGIAHSTWSNSSGGIRKIDVQQNWLARLFRVKPAMDHLCFNMPKRRARQEVAILLREWRKYGIKDVEVDKQRNIIFARVGVDNCEPPLPSSLKIDAP